jgi:hypothetical protein
MSRHNAAAKKPSRAQTLAAVYDDQPTKPLPTVTLFDLIAETRRLDAARAEGEQDPDRTLTIDPGQRERLLADAIASNVDLDLEAPPVTKRCGDEDATLIQAPSPLRCVTTSFDLLSVSPPASSPASGMRVRVTPEEASEARSTSATPSWLRNVSSETWMVLAIWAMAFSLIGLLLVIAT